MLLQHQVLGYKLLATAAYSRAHAVNIRFFFKFVKFTSDFLRFFIFKMNTALQVWDGELSVITTPPPRVSAPTDIVIKVAFSGICGTDLHVLAKELPAAKSVILGHEFSGVVTEIGSEVKHCSVGERSGENKISCYF